MTTVPDFFQDESEEALRLQVEWQDQHLKLEARFFARLLRKDERRFSSWVSETEALSRDKEAPLRDWWQIILHLLSFQDFDEEKVRALLERPGPTEAQAGRSPFTPPWSASSLKDYLENRGCEAIPEVDRWMESFRFGGPARHSLPIELHFRTVS